MKAAIQADVTILRFFSWLIELIPGTDSFSLSECVEEFSSLMTLQLDMRLEADHLERFRRNFHLTEPPTSPSSSLPFFNGLPSFLDRLLALLQKNVIEVAASKRKVTFPQPLRPYVSDSVLVETYEAGR